MTATPPPPDSPPRRPLRALGIALAAIALTGFFMVLRFPYDRLADTLARRVEQDSGTRIRLGHVSPGWVRWGPGLEAEDVIVQQPDGTRVELARIAARPALALSWFSGAPALAGEIEAPMGEVSGVVTLGSERSFVGSVRGVDLSQLPLADLGPQAELEGTGDADLDLLLSPDGPEGSVHFTARDGSFSHPRIPITIPFQELSGDLRLGGGRMAEIVDFELRSPLASGTAKGTIGKAASFAAAPLRIDLELSVSGAIQGSLNAQGVSVGRDGKVAIRVMGTPAQPILR